MKTFRTFTKVRDSLFQVFYIRLNITHQKSKYTHALLGINIPFGRIAKPSLPCGSLCSDRQISNYRIANAFIVTQFLYLCNKASAMRILRSNMGRIMLIC